MACQQLMYTFHLSFQSEEGQKSDMWEEGNAYGIWKLICKFEYLMCLSKFLCI